MRTRNRDFEMETLSEKDGLRGYNQRDKIGESVVFGNRDAPSHITHENTWRLCGDMFTAAKCPIRGYISLYLIQKIISTAQKNVIIQLQSRYLPY